MCLNIFHRRSKPHVQKPPVSPGDIPRPLALGRKVGPEEIRDLGELIRKRYQLDVEIWSLRHVRPRDRPVVEDKMRRSDATLQKIYRTIYSWNTPDAFKTLNDWVSFQEIKTRIEMDGKRFWAINPPWDEE